MKNYRVIMLLALMSFSSACQSITPNTTDLASKTQASNNSFIKEDIDSLKVSNNPDSLKEGPNTTGVLKEGPNTTGVLKEGPNTTGVLKEGPNTTGVLKEGPNTTGVLKEGPNTTGVLKSTEKFVLLTTEGKDYNSPVTPDNIQDIEIIYLRSKITLKAENIKLKGQESFNSMADNEYNAVEYDGNGGFKFKIISPDEDMIVKVKMLDGTKVTLPLINDLSSIKAVILKDKSETIAKATSYDGSYAYMLKNNEKNQEVIISIDKNNDKQSYSVQELEDKVGNGQKKYDVTQEKTNKEVKKLITSDIKNISNISTFIGSWVYKTKDNMINLYIFDSEKDKFLWMLKINDTIYQGFNTYNKDKSSEISVYSDFDNKLIDFKLYNRSPNKINLKSNNDLSILGNLDINLTRNIRFKF